MVVAVLGRMEAGQGTVDGDTETTDSIRMVDLKVITRHMPNSHLVIQPAQKR